MQLKIDPELKALIPPLSMEEYRLLEDSILKEGCREKIITWDDTIVDGHNRHEICTRHGLKFSTEDRDFDNIETVKVWMIDNQKGRRNLTDGWKWELAQTRKQILAEKGKEKQGQRTDLLSKIDKKLDDNHNTQKELATELGWSTGKVAMADKVWKSATPEIKEKVKSGDVSINQAYTELRKDEKIQERKHYIEKQKYDIEMQEVIQPTGLFDVIAIDPPWSYGREYSPDGSRVANPYPEMSQQQLLEINLPAKSDSVLFLWTTHAFIFDAKQLLDSWGFSYKATIVWDKEKIGMGAWFRMQCEFCLVGIKGKPFFENTTERDIIRESRREHSRKPDAFYSMVEKITAGRRLEYFAREKRTGWEVFGNETEKF
jgi:N6-adenosine-specific RNA methylase IME4